MRKSGGLKEGTLAQNSIGGLLRHSELLKRGWKTQTPAKKHRGGVGL